MGGTRISVGAPFFGLTFIPLVVPLLILVPFGPLLAWKRGDLLAASQRLLAALAVAIAVATIAAVAEGARIAPACDLVGIDARTLRRWKAVMVCSRVIGGRMLIALSHRTL